MIKEEQLKQETEDWLNKWELCNKCENKVDCISNFSYCKKVVLQSYLASAEPREKQIAELKKQLAELKKQLDLKEKALSKAKKETKRIADRVNKDKRRLIRRKAELEAQIEKLIDFVLSKTECCDVCPITDTCNNSEGTCPYAGILSKGEEAVNREWIMQKIAKEIKEK